MYFVRFGTLTPQKHKHFNDEERFHVAPVKYGIYAFPAGKIETFLLTATNTVDNSSCKCAWIKDKNGNKIKYDDLFHQKEIVDRYGFTETINFKIKKEYLPFTKSNKIKIRDIISDNDGYALYYKRPKIIFYEGNIWHHLLDFVSVKDIINQKGCWVLTDMKTYVQAYVKSDAKERADLCLKDNMDDSFKGIPSRYRNYYSKDHYEVFIEKIK